MIERLKRTSGRRQTQLGSKRAVRAFMPTPAKPQPRAPKVRRLQAAVLAAVLFASLEGMAPASPKLPEIPGQIPRCEPGEPGSPTEGSSTTAPGTPTLPPAGRPRTLAAAREHRARQAVEFRKPESGTPPDRVATTDRGVSFEAYDDALVQAVQRHWQDLLDQSQVVPRFGKVVLDFNLTPDGRVTDLRVTDCQVGLIVGLLCQKAVADLAPYVAWPSDMRRKLGASHRPVTLTFHCFEAGVARSRSGMQRDDDHLVGDLWTGPRIEEHRGSLPAATGYSIGPVQIRFPDCGPWPMIPESHSWQPTSQHECWEKLGPPTPHSSPCFRPPPPPPLPSPPSGR